MPIIVDDEYDNPIRRVKPLKSMLINSYLLRLTSTYKYQLVLLTYLIEAGPDLGGGRRAKGDFF